MSSTLRPRIIYCSGGHGFISTKWWLQQCINASSFTRTGSRSGFSLTTSPSARQSPSTQMLSTTSSHRMSQCRQNRGLSPAPGQHNDCRLIRARERLSSLQLSSFNDKCQEAVDEDVAGAPIQGSPFNSNEHPHMQQFHLQSYMLKTQPSLDSRSTWMCSKLCIRNPMVKPLGSR